jgi:hypothetical protein
VGHIRVMGGFLIGLRVDVVSDARKLWASRHKRRSVVEELAVERDDGTCEEK